MKNGLKSLIGLHIFSVGDGIHFMRPLTGVYRPRGTGHSLHGRVQVGIKPSRDSRTHGAAQCNDVFCLAYSERQAANISMNLQPQRTLRSAAAGAQLGHLHTALRKGFQNQSCAKRRRLHDCPKDFFLARGQREPQKGALGERIAVGTAVSLKMLQRRNTIASRRNARRALIQKLIYALAFM